MNEEALTDLLALLPIEGPPGKEGAVAAWIRARLAGMGVAAEQMTHDQTQDQSEYGGEVGNLIVHLPGRGAGPRLMFSTHMDTVPNAVGCRPRLVQAQGRIVNDAPGKALGGGTTGWAVPRSCIWSGHCLQNTAIIRRSHSSSLCRRRWGWSVREGWTHLCWAIPGLPCASTWTVARPMNL